tara:strand:- start:196 stop:588 length:393 start_codon:yes stop_codon:yes gene_type:complete
MFPHQGPVAVKKQAMSSKKPARRLLKLVAVFLDAARDASTSSGGSARVNVTRLTTPSCYPVMLGTRAKTRGAKAREKAQKQKVSTILRGRLVTVQKDQQAQSRLRKLLPRPQRYYNVLVKSCAAQKPKRI